MNAYTRRPQVKRGPLDRLHTSSMLTRWLIAPVSGWALAILLGCRLGAFRVDRPWYRGYFGEPVHDPLHPLETFKAANYRPEGRHLLPWYRAAMLLFILGAIAAIIHTESGG